VSDRNGDSAIIEIRKKGFSVVSNELGVMAQGPGVQAMAAAYRASRKARVDEFGPVLGGLMTPGARRLGGWGWRGGRPRGSLGVPGRVPPVPLCAAGFIHTWTAGAGAHPARPNAAPLTVPPPGPLAASPAGFCEVAQARYAPKTCNSFARFMTLAANKESL
jgi:hypothetical protein